MDGRGSIAQSLTWLAPWRALPPTARARVAERMADEAGLSPTRWCRRAQRGFAVIVKLRIPRGIGIAATAAVILASLAYGMIKGDHVATVIAALKDARDTLANAAGFRVVALALSGAHRVSREEILAGAGVSGRSSLLFLDVEAARERLKTNPWIAEATLLKLYPGELQISVKERAAFALWQKGGRVAVIAEDGTVLEPYVSPALLRLPLVVGKGAETRAKDFLALLDRYPDIRALVRASILVGERRWNLRLRNGLDVRLPETDVATALERLAALDRDAKLTTRDIVAIDLRLADRVTVRLSEAAAQARTDAAKDKKGATKKGGKA